MDAKVWNFSKWISKTNPGKLKEDYGKMLKEADFEIINFIEHHFKPQGYTCLWLLGESHFAIHTFPEHGKSYIELTSCHEGKHDIFAKKVAKTEHINKNT